MAPLISNSYADQIINEYIADKINTDYDIVYLADSYQKVLNQNDGIKNSKSFRLSTPDKYNLSLVQKILNPELAKPAEYEELHKAYTTDVAALGKILDEKSYALLFTKESETVRIHAAFLFKIFAL